MATANTSLRVADLDFNSIRNNLKTYLNSQSEFNDYNFEGSGLSVLLDILAYNTYYNSFYLNMVANEAFLDTAQIRQNILSQAKLINYIPASAHGADAMINVRVTPTNSENQTIEYIVLDKYTRLLGADIEGKTYPFVTVNSNTAHKSGTSFYFPNVWIKQGEVITQQYLMGANNTTAKFEIPSANVDTSTLTITVQESSSNSYTEEYHLSQDITEVTSNSRIYFLEENENLNYTLQFGDGILGYRPKIGNIVIATYIDTQGSEANDVTRFNAIDPIGVYSSNVRISTVASSRTGIDKESIETIKLRAPQFYTAQNRCVTVRDYETILTKEYDNIDAVSIWGGEDNDPPVYGKVYISIKTKGYYTLTNLEKENIKNTLIKSKNVVTVTPVIVDPDYIFVTVRGKVYYNPQMTTKTANELLDIVKQAVYKYANDELNTYKATFKKAKLQNYIQTSDASITGTDITIYLQSRQKVDRTQSKKYYYYFNTPVEKGTFTNKLFSFPQITVLDTSLTPRNVFYEEVPDSFTGVDMIEVISPGRNYASANVTITGDGTGATAKATVVNGKIVSIAVTNKGINYSRALVNIDGPGGVEATAKAVLQARNGTLRTYYYNDLGSKVIVNPDAGTIDYDTGEIVLYSIKPSAVLSNDYYDLDILTINAVPGGEIIPPLRNRILTVDDNNIQTIQLEMVAEK